MTMVYPTLQKTICIYDFMNLFFTHAEGLSRNYPLLILKLFLLKTNYNFLVKVLNVINITIITIDMIWFYK